jgi:3-hydroxymyristoyl/3-hydroxydecanoyl-(acyl carrier protein) dehydratase
LESGHGTVEPPVERSHQPLFPDAQPFAPLVPVTRESYSDDALEALRDGDLGACFGAAFLGKALDPAMCLPSGRMRLVHRIIELDPTGGRFGRGLVVGEADVHPDDWFLTCHFSDDPVMPGTLMYECCLHTLRVLLLRLGWVMPPGQLPEAFHYAPVPSVASRLKCRGQVTPETKKVRYQLEVKELGYGPEPFAVADAFMFADGRRVVKMENMSVRLAGLSRADVEGAWRKPVLFDRQKILAYAYGNPSEAFGPSYRPFDLGGPRKLSRLPSPPFSFVDRVLSADAAPGVMKPDGWLEAEYDVPRDAWYFAASRQKAMPFSVLLEVALQPCGFLAAYLGSALCAQEDLYFRNLDGRAVMHEEVGPDAGTLRMRAKLNRVSQAGGMILQQFDFEVLREGWPVYVGDTGFGFFPAQSLAQQVGLRGLSLPDAAHGPGAEFAREAPLTPEDCAAHPSSGRGLVLPARAYGMLDVLDQLSLTGGPNGLGQVLGRKRVDPAEWFFKAHFFGDPVMPGSLGLESLVLLLKLYARERFGALSSSHRFQTLALGREHRWTYRGQVIPADKEVRVWAGITRVEDGDAPVVVADGLLSVDGRVIYQMKDFALRLVPDEAGKGTP